MTAWIPSTPPAIFLHSEMTHSPHKVRSRHRLSPPRGSYKSHEQFVPLLRPVQPESVAPPLHTSHPMTPADHRDANKHGFNGSHTHSQPLHDCTRAHHTAHTAMQKRGTHRSSWPFQSRQQLQSCTCSHCGQKKRVGSCVDAAHGHSCGLTIEKTAEVDEEHRCSRLVCEAYTRAPSGDEPHALYNVCR